MTEVNQASKFRRLLTISSSTKLADILISAKTTLPWLLNNIGASSWMVALLVPLRESGALLPQWLLQTHTRAFTDRTALWRKGILVQSVSILLMPLALVLLNSQEAGLGILALLAIMSLGRALCSLTYKDIQGESIAKGKRGALVGLASSISGALSVAVALILLLGPAGTEQSQLLAMLALGSALFLVALPLSFALEVKFKDDSGVDKTDNEPEGLLATLQNKALRHLIISRCLLLHAALITPFMVTLSVQGQSSFVLPYFIIAGSLATFISSYLWGKLSDFSAVLCIRIASLVCLLSSTAYYFCLSINSLPLKLALFFFVSLGYAGIRTARTTYIIDIAEEKQRTAFVAAANTVVGILLLATGATYALVYNFLEQDIILVMSVFLFVGLVHSHFLVREK